MRLACLFVPDFPFVAWGRVDPDLRGAAVAVTEGCGPRAAIVAVSAEAARRGVSAGMGAAQGRAVCSQLVLRPASADAERAAQAALCDVADSFSPRVEDAGGGTAYLDCDGLGAEQSESDLARALVARAAQVRLDLAVGIASTKIVASLAARNGCGIAVVVREDEWSFLAPLPISLLAPGRNLAETFARWGIRRFGDLAALPASAVATRLGPEAALLARRIRGEDETPLVPRPPALCFEEAVDLDYQIDSLDPLLFVVRPLLDRLTARLALRGFVCGDLRLSLRLANRGLDERTVAVAAAGNDTKALLMLVRAQTEAHPPTAPVSAVRVAAVAERLRSSQLDLFSPRTPAPAQLSVTLARLSALCGADRVGAPVAPDSHRPEAFSLKAFRGGEGESGAPVSADTAPMRVALRALRPPQALEVFCNRDHLDFVRPLTTERTSENGYGCTGRVVTASGPWRIEGEWWREDAFRRDYYDVQLSDGVIYRLFFDRREQRWFADGVYD